MELLSAFDVKSNSESAHSFPHFLRNKSANPLLLGFDEKFQLNEEGMELFKIFLLISFLDISQLILFLMSASLIRPKKRIVCFIY